MLCTTKILEYMEESYHLNILLALQPEALVNTSGRVDPALFGQCNLELIDQPLNQLLKQSYFPV